MKRPRLFISYSHHPAEHKERVQQMVAELAANEALEIHGDFEVTDPQGPARGWIAWMREQLEVADWILVICNPTYREAWEKRIAEGSRGATYEAALLMHELYTAGMVNRRLIPVTLGSDGVESVPKELRDFTRYSMPAELDELVRKILRSTWLGRALEGVARVGAASTLADTTPTQVFSEAASLASTARFSGAGKLLKALEEEADRFYEAVAEVSGASELESLRADFRRRFCPKAREWIRLHGTLPELLGRIFDNECGN